VQASSPCSNISHNIKAIFGFRDDTGLDSGSLYSWSASIFYLGFLIGAIPAAILAQRYPVHRVLFGIVFVWGGCLMAAAGCKSYEQVFVQRFFLGFLESGVSPIFMLSVGSFYNKKEQSFRQGLWYSASKNLIHPTLKNFAMWQFL
jgi:MFS family permease